MIVLRVVLSIAFLLLLVALIFSPLVFLEIYHELWKLLKKKLEEEKEEPEIEVELSPEEKAYRRKHEALVQKYYDELGGPEVFTVESCNKDVIKQRQEALNDTVDNHIRELLDGILPIGMPMDRDTIRGYLWEMKQAADVNEDLLRKHLGWSARR